MEIDKRRREKFVSSIIQWEKQNFRKFSWRKNRTPYNVFIAEIILKRTTSKAAASVYDQFISIFPNIDVLYQADIKEIEEILEPVGLQKQRSKGLKEAVQYVKENYEGSFPESYNDLLKIPYVGPYTGGAIVSFSYGRPAAIVDSNVSRVLSRAFMDALQENPKQKQITELTKKLVPQKEHELFNWGLLDLGALICTYRKCCSEVCPVKKLCYFFSETHGLCTDLRKK